MQPYEELDLHCNIYKSQEYNFDGLMGFPYSDIGFTI